MVFQPTAWSQSSIAFRMDGREFGKREGAGGKVRS